MPGACCVVVGLKTDLRHDEGTIAKLSERREQPVSAEEAQAVARKFGAKYAECSAKTQDGVKAVFDLALLEAMSHKDRANAKAAKQKQCALL
jgi:Ras homolog gene family, member A